MSESVLVSNLLQVFLGLLAVLILIYIISLIMKRYPKMTTGLGLRAQQNSLKIKDRLNLGRHGNLVVVEWKTQEYLLSVSSDQILKIADAPRQGNSGGHQSDS